MSEKLWQEVGKLHRAKKVLKKRFGFHFTDTNLFHKIEFTIKELELTFKKILEFQDF